MNYGLIPLNISYENLSGSGQIFVSVKTSKGNSQVYNPDEFYENSVIAPTGKRSVKGHLGNLPAIEIPNIKDGLYPLVFHSTPKTIDYPNFEKVEKFAKKEGVEWTIGKHRVEIYPLKILLLRRKFRWRSES